MFQKSMMAKYKQRCSVCKNNWALVYSGRQKFPVCIDCEMKVIQQPLEDKEYFKMFDIPLEWYRENHFLRSVRYKYGRFGNLTDKKIEALKKTVKELKKKTKNAATRI